MMTYEYLLDGRTVDTDTLRHLVVTIDEDERIRAELQAARDKAWAKCARLGHRVSELEDVLRAVLPSSMGGYPDLFFPSGFDGDDPWLDWEEAAKRALAEEASTPTPATAMPAQDARSHGCPSLGGHGSGPGSTATAASTATPDESSPSLPPGRSKNEGEG